MASRRRSARQGFLIFFAYSVSLEERCLFGWIRRRRWKTTHSRSINSDVRSQEMILISKVSKVLVWERVEKHGCRCSSYVNWVVWYVFFLLSFLSCLGNTVSDRGTVLMGFSCWREHCKKERGSLLIIEFVALEKLDLIFVFFSVNFYLNIYV